MQEYVILSGKGGTGKTSLTACFALLAGKVVCCDADVDAADLHLLLAPEIQSRHDFYGGHIAKINREACSGCATCLQLCRFDAIRPDLTVDPLACEGCGVCVDLCPEQAVDFPQRWSGEWFVSQCRSGPLVHARLGIAEENSGKLVSLIRQQARQLAERQGMGTIITDGPPGIGCPVIASMSGAGKIILIVEPTFSGIHDAKRVIALAQHFGIGAMLCVNRCDINPELSARLEKHARDSGVTVLPRIPYDPVFVHALMEGRTVIEHDPGGRAARKVRAVWQAITAEPDSRTNILAGALPLPYQQG